VCFDIVEGGAPVGRIDFELEVEAVEVESGETGLKDFDFWILLNRLWSECRLLRNR
jgi:hypothetical protein